VSDVGNTAESSSGRTQLYQGVRCGALAVAFPYGWATNIVEKFELTAIPKAPAWLIGAANIDGRITPVVDLSRYGAQGQRAQRSELNTMGQRLLIGGAGADSDDSRLAVVFVGLPQQLSRKEGEGNTEAAEAGGMTDGFALSSQGERYAVVKVHRLFEQLAAELSTL
jgi:hypothetical protein